MVNNSFVTKFEEQIKTYEDMMFGLILYQETSPKPVQLLQKISYKNMKRRGDKAIEESKSILSDAKQGMNVDDRIECFEWPVILADMKYRIDVLLKCYEKLFPESSREQTLSKQEKIALRNEVINNI